MGSKTGMLGVELCAYPSFRVSVSFLKSRGYSLTMKGIRFLTHSRCSIVVAAAMAIGQRGHLGRRHLSSPCRAILPDQYSLGIY